MKRRAFDRDLSWLEFNARVLSEAQQTDTPLLERLKFLAIVSSNFDEFFMVRVARLRRVREGTEGGARAAGELLHKVEARVRSLVESQYCCLEQELLPSLARAGLRLVRTTQCTVEERTQLAEVFESELMPLVTPRRVAPDEPFPFVAGLRTSALFRLQGPTAPDGPAHSEPLLAVVQIPHGIPRFVGLDALHGRSFALIEDVILENAAALFPGYTVRESLLFRVTRDADLGVDEEREEDFVEAMAEILTRRKVSAPVRLETSGGSEALRAVLRERLGLLPSDSYHVPGPLDLGGFMALATIGGYKNLVYPEWPSVTPRGLDDDETIWDVLKRRDLLLHHPYESFDAVVHLLSAAAADPAVLAIKMTLYRTSGDSPVIAALERAAAAGKQVAVLVELKARFDEARNIGWAERLERAGGIVIYGVAGLKVHAKALLIVRREADGVERYLHLGTGVSGG